AEIDAAVRERTLDGAAIYELDCHALAACAPELIVTQALCPVCAVSYEDVRALASALPGRPPVVALDPHTIAETHADLRALAGAPPDVVVVMPCGYDAEQSAGQARAHARALACTGAQRIVAVNASAYFSRPGPRLTDGVELLAHVLHPGALPPPACARE